VLRDGRTVASLPVEGMSEQALVEYIVGRPIEDLYTEPPEVRGETVFEAADVWGTIVEGFSTAVRAGEIVGIAGIAGSGRDEIAALLSGAKRAAGTLSVGPTPVPCEPRLAQRLGVVFVPADRKLLGSIQSQTVAANITVSRLRTLFGSGWLTNRGINGDALKWIREVDLRPTDPDRPLCTLSGGNQQKAVMARVLRLEPRVVVLDEPTQGVDVGAKATIYELLARAAAGGAAVIVCSSDAEELANVCDRVLVMRRGRIATELHGSRLTSDTIVEQSLR
jgi:ribose transport system ATP-binding protein